MVSSSELNTLKTLLGKEGDNSEDSLLSTLLSLSEQRLINYLYPYNACVSVLPPRYSFKLIEIAAYLYNRRGSEGELSHSENGVSRSYESADIPDSMLNDLVRYTEVL